MANRIPKYRPSLTGEQINHLITLCRKDSSIQSIHIISVLAEFEHKIRNGAIIPSHVIAIKNPLDVELGFTMPKAKEVVSISQLYEFWKANPATLTVEELSRVREYRYTNDMMDPDEQVQYENEILGNVTDGA